MTKDQIIQGIENLYPIDSDFQKTNEIGEKLLMQAIKYSDWRSLPIDILREYLTLCEYQERTNQ